jgi:hypothetical protein
VEEASARRDCLREIEQSIEHMAGQKRAAVEKLQLFDANMWLGRSLYFPLAEEINPAELQGILQSHGICGGLVSHWDGPALSAQDGNNALMKLGEALPADLYTVWTGLPLLPREQGPLPGLGKPDPRMRGVRLFPKTHRYTLSPWVVGSLCSWCIEYGLPLFLWHVEIEWDSLYNLAQAFPDMNIVLESQWQKILYHNRTLYSLMRDNENIYLEISNFIGQDFITHGVCALGAGRFVYGSFLPQNDPLVSAGMLIDTDISDSDKKRIAGNNMRNMIEGVGRR